MGWGVWAGTPASPDLPPRRRMVGLSTSFACRRAGRLRAVTLAFNRTPVMTGAWIRWTAPSAAPARRPARYEA